MDSGCASTRVTASVPLPAPNGTTMVTGFCGKFSAPAAKPGHSNSAKAQAIGFMFPLVGQVQAAGFILACSLEQLLRSRCRASPGRAPQRELRGAGAGEPPEGGARHQPGAAGVVVKEQPAHHLAGGIETRDQAPIEVLDRRL